MLLPRLLHRSNPISLLLLQSALLLRRQIHQTILQGSLVSTQSTVRRSQLLGVSSAQMIQLKRHLVEVVIVFIRHVALLPNNYLLFSLNVSSCQLVFPMSLQTIDLFALVIQVANHTSSLAAFPQRLLLKLQNCFSVVIFAVNTNLPINLNCGFAKNDVTQSDYTFIKHIVIAMPLQLEDSLAQGNHLNTIARKTHCRFETVVQLIVIRTYAARRDRRIMTHLLRQKLKTFAVIYKLKSLSQQRI